MKIERRKKKGKEGDKLKKCEVLLAYLFAENIHCKPKNDDYTEYMILDRKKFAERYSKLSMKSFGRKRAASKYMSIQRYINKNRIGKFRDSDILALNQDVINTISIIKMVDKIQDEDSI